MVEHLPGLAGARAEAHVGAELLRSREAVDRADEGDQCDRGEFPNPGNRAEQLGLGGPQPRFVDLSVESLARVLEEENHVEPPVNLWNLQLTESLSLPTKAEEAIVIDQSSSEKRGVRPVPDGNDSLLVVHSLGDQSSKRTSLRRRSVGGRERVHAEKGSERLGVDMICLQARLGNQASPERVR